MRKNSELRFCRPMMEAINSPTLALITEWVINSSGLSWPMLERARSVIHFWISWSPKITRPV